jgi:hypothetical protein
MRIIFHWKLNEISIKFVALTHDCRKTYNTVNPVFLWNEEMLKASRHRGRTSPSVMSTQTNKTNGITILDTSHNIGLWDATYGRRYIGCSAAGTFQRMTRKKGFSRTYKRVVSMPFLPDLRFYHIMK